MKQDMYETGISDHHKIIILVLRKTIAKGKPKTSFIVTIKSLIKILLMKH